jgi:hypothetical protein
VTISAASATSITGIFAAGYLDGYCAYNNSPSEFILELLPVGAPVTDTQFITINPYRMYVSDSALLSIGTTFTALQQALTTTQQVAYIGNSVF